MAMAIDPIPITLTVTVTVTATVTAAVDVVETPGSDAVKITGIVVGGVFGLALLGSAGSLLWMWMRRRYIYQSQFPRNMLVC